MHEHLEFEGRSRGGRVVILREALVALIKYLIIRSWKGMAESSVLSMVVQWTQGQSCFHVYKITNTRRLGLSS